MNLLRIFVPSLGLILGCGYSVAADLPVVISSTDPHLHYVGRFDWESPGGPRCSWSASGIVLKFQGTDLNLKVREKGNDRWQVVLDGQPSIVLELRNGDFLYSIATHLADAEHTVELFKRTEAHVGETQITGLQINEGGKLLSPSLMTRRILVIGDSISCGYGNEASSKEEHFSPETENACKTYGALASRKLGAEYVCIAWSGKGVSRNFPGDNGPLLPALFDQTLAENSENPWNFRTWIPDVVVINLGTNDFMSGVPDKGLFLKAYGNFLVHLRTEYPHSEMVVCLGPLLNDQWPPNAHSLSTAREFLAELVKSRNANGDAHIQLLEFPRQDPADGIGADWHPSLKTHELMAGQLETTVRKILHW